MNKIKKIFKIKKLKKIKKKSSDCVKLSELISSRGINYKLIDRNDYAFIYKILNYPSRYEVFEHRISKAVTSEMGGRVVEFEAKERFPSNECFGKWAWSCMNKEKALLKFKQITKVGQNELNRND